MLRVCDFRDSIFVHAKLFRTADYATTCRCSTSIDPRELSVDIPDSLMGVMCQLIEPSTQRGCVEGFLAYLHL